MAATRTAARGLSDADVESLRAVLGTGRRPKVVFTESAGQVAGQVGQVVELRDPAAGDEWVVVRFGRDELPFSPADVALPAKAAVKSVPARKAAQAKAAVPAPREQELTGPPLLEPAVSAGKRGPAAGDNGAVSKSSEQAAAAAETARPAPRRSSGKAKAPAELAVTLSYVDGEWTVQASRGAKVVARPVPVKAPDALRMVALLDSPAVQQAVEEIVSAARTRAEEQAERLRRELAEVEARLAELRDAG